MTYIHIWSPTSTYAHLVSLLWVIQTKDLSSLVVALLIRCTFAGAYSYTIHGIDHDYIINNIRKYDAGMSCACSSGGSWCDIVQREWTCGTLVVCVKGNYAA
jgi:hypothetical protein